MAERRLILDRGEEAVLRRLDDERRDIERLERLLGEAERRRNTLLAKAVFARIPMRTIEPHAGLTNARISQITKAPT